MPYVPPTYTDISTNDVNNARPPSASDWLAATDDVHYLLGRGAQLVPCVEFPNIGNRLWTFKEQINGQIPIFPRKQALNRYHQFVVRTVANDGVNPGTGGTLTLKIGEDVARTFTIGAGTTVITYREGNLTQSLDTIKFLQFTASCTTSASFGQYSCFEPPRLYLSASTQFDNGIDETSFQVRTPIYHDIQSQPENSVRALAFAVSESFASTGQNGVFSFITPLKSGSMNVFATSSFVVGTAGGSNVASFTSGGVPVFVRRTYFGDSTGTLECIYGVRGTNALSTGTLRLVSSIESVTIPVLCGTSYLFGSATIRVPCAGTGGLGLPDGFSNVPTIDIQQTGSGAGTLLCHNILLGQRRTNI